MTGQHSSQAKEAIMLVMEGGGSSSVCDMPAVVDGGSG